MKRFKDISRSRINPDEIYVVKTDCNKHYQPFGWFDHTIKNIEVKKVFAYVNDHWAKNTDEHWLEIFIGQMVDDDMYDWVIEEANSSPYKKYMLNNIRNDRKRFHSEMSFLFSRHYPNDDDNNEEMLMSYWHTAQGNDRCYILFADKDAMDKWLKKELDVINENIRKEKERSNVLEEILNSTKNELSFEHIGA